MGGHIYCGPQYSDSDPFNELEQWIAEHLRSDLRVKALADHVHMSPRNFARVYAQTRGRTPAKAKIAASAAKSKCARALSEAWVFRRASIANVSHQPDHDVPGLVSANFHLNFAGKRATR